MYMTDVLDNENPRTQHLSVRVVCHYSIFTRGLLAQCVIEVQLRERERGQRIGTTAKCNRMKALPWPRSQVDGVWERG